ncbi:protein kinase C-binding protein 1-like [Acropora millepora]|uniref:protein kinase C-binding protein 1-like n=1 Tax=Acropora millepora TaxID=45264 RepID=UPI001CF156F8|nr:protein kinase C-binding protein 1-like [Acropora millepora]
MIFGSCQSLLSEMRDVTIQVAANILEADATKCEPRILEQQIQTLELQLLQEREQSTKRLQAMRATCQSQILNMATTVKEYFKKTMEHTSSQHKKELERIHSEGIQEGMRRLREILQNHMACTHCGSTTPRLFLCSGCWSACYCGEACQRNHWPTHMQACGALRSTSNSN